MGPTRFFGSKWLDENNYPVKKDIGNIVNNKWRGFNE